MASAAACGGRRSGCRPLPRPVFLSEAFRRPVIDAHGCGFPDAACSSCEAAVTPPCCNTPYLCGGPFPDCHPTAGGYNQAYAPGDDLKAEAVADIRRPKPKFSGPHGNYTVCASCGPLDLVGDDSLPDDRDRRDASDGVVHQCCCSGCCISNGHQCDSW